MAQTRGQATEKKGTNVAASKGTEVTLNAFKTLRSTCTPVGSAMHLTCLNLSFLICKVGLNNASLKGAGGCSGITHRSTCRMW